MIEGNGGSSEAALKLVTSSFDLVIIKVKEL